MPNDNLIVFPLDRVSIDDTHCKQIEADGSKCDKQVYKNGFCWNHQKIKNKSVPYILLDSDPDK